jgi:hypothetical protein
MIIRCSHDLSRGIGSSQGALLGCCAMISTTVISKGWTNQSSSITHNPNVSNKNEGLNCCFVFTKRQFHYQKMRHKRLFSWTSNMETSSRTIRKRGTKALPILSEDGSFQKWLDEQCGKPNAINYRINQPWLVVILHHPIALRLVAPGFESLPSYDSDARQTLPVAYVW